MCATPDDMFTLLLFTRWKIFHSNTGGSTWPDCSDSWQDPCGCDRVICSDDGKNIVEIHLNNHSLTGPLPTSTVSLFSKLERLVLANNSLYGALPSDLVGSSLVELDISHNLFTSSVPDIPWSQLTEGCNVAGNEFACPMPVDAFSDCASVEVPSCYDLSNVTSPLCYASQQKLYTDPTLEKLIGSLNLDMAALYANATKNCGAIYTTHQCNVSLDWESAMVRELCMVYSWCHATSLT